MIFHFIQKNLYQKILIKKKYIKLWDSISDLPQILSGKGEEGQEYIGKPKNKYQKSMRVGANKIFNHIAMKHTDRLIERFKQIKYGQSVKHVSSKYSQRKRGAADKLSGKVYSQNNMRPFPNLPSPTVAASFQSNFIHPYLNRNFTAREAARIQSFPDKYIFKGKNKTMSWEKNLSQYQQIGNVASSSGKSCCKNYQRLFKVSIFGAVGETRTLTGNPHAPQACLSTNFSTTADIMRQ